MPEQTTPSMTTERLAAIGERYFETAMLGGYIPTDMRGYVQQAVEMEETVTYGRVAGLTDTEAREVIDVMIGFYSKLPFKLSWREIRNRMILRSCGQEWQPSLREWKVSDDGR